MILYDGEYDGGDLTKRAGFGLEVKILTLPSFSS